MSYPSLRVADPSRPSRSPAPAPPFRLLRIPATVDFLCNPPLSPPQRSLPLLHPLFERWFCPRSPCRYRARGRDEQTASFSLADCAVAVLLALSCAPPPVWAPLHVLRTACQCMASAIAPPPVAGPSQVGLVVCIGVVPVLLSTMYPQVSAKRPRTLCSHSTSYRLFFLIFA